MPDKTIAQKLYIREGYLVLLLNEPEKYRSILGELPLNVTVTSKSNGPVDLIQCFVTSKKDVEAQLQKLKSSLTPDGLLWVTYPKGSSKVETDVNRDSIREYAASIGLQAVAMISVDDTWSALRLKATR